jgi:hypothetical protein
MFRVKRQVGCKKSKGSPSETLLPKKVFIADAKRVFQSLESTLGSKLKSSPD